jgi:eukaryotic-like serine/threonine-protein kinase
MIGRTIQNYRIEELIGEGGMGTVYRATDILLHRPVAVKMLHAHLLRDATFMERFRNEAVLSAQLNHPNVATLYNLLQDRNDNLMIMELVSGQTLDKLVKHQGKLSVEIAVKITMQALDGLQHAHQRGILHRDIKPANLMLTHEGVVKLMDFGIARLQGSTRLTRTDRVVGTLEYMAPELLDRAEPSVQSDLYAVGVLLYELLSGKMPFEATTDATLISQILTKKPIPLRSYFAELPKNLEMVLERLFQKKPDKRYASASELKNVLANIVAPGAINLQTPEVPKKNNFSLAGLAETTVQKPATSPTVLASADSKYSFLKEAKAVLTSLEGMVLGGAVFIAASIVVIWTFFITPSPEPPIADKALKDSFLLNKRASVVTKDTIQIKASEVAIISEPDKQPKTDVAVPTPVQKAPKQQRPSQPNEKKIVLTSPKDDAAPVTNEATPANPEKRVEPKPTRAVTVELNGESVVIQFMETVTSDTPVGKMLSLQTTNSIETDGLNVILAGAPVRGRVVKAHPASDAKKAFLAVRFEAVQAVNGEWVPLKYPEYSDKSSSQVVFQAGRRVNNVRTVRATLSVQL